jgi:acyl CoA:acetate/3-ketoacid CoA transferase beta subunit
VEPATLPITGKAVVNLIITELAVFEVKDGGGLVLTELLSDASVDDIRAKTGPPFDVALKGSAAL